MTNPNSLKGYDLFVGIDVDKHSYAFTVKDRDTILKSKKIPADPGQLLKYMQKAFNNRNILYAYESGPTGFGLYDYLAKERQNCYVIPAMSIPKASNHRIKNNRIDSENIAVEVSAGKVAPIRVPCGFWRDLRCLAITRNNYVRSQKTAKQRIKALLLLHNLQNSVKERSGYWSNNYIIELKKLECGYVVRRSLDMLLDDLAYSRAHLASSTREVKAFCKKHEPLERNIAFLQSIPGIGFTTAATLLARIGDPTLLRNPRELSAFIGLVPAEHSTGDTVNRLGITHLGDKTLRSLLIEAAWASIRKDTRLKEFFHRIYHRQPRAAAAQKAITAVARKLTLIIYRILKDQRNYRNSY